LFGLPVQKKPSASCGSGFLFIIIRFTLRREAYMYCQKCGGGSLESGSGPDLF
jgi:hypothetical protein